VQPQLAEPGASRPFSWPHRYTVVALFFFATALCYVDRVSISVAIIPLARERGYDAAAQGIILSAFFWGYLWPQLPGGWIADRIGGRRVLAFGVALWSLATLLTPAASAAFALLIAARVLLGLGEAVNFPAIHSIAARWTLASERSRALALNFSGMYFGTIAAFVASPPIIDALGWRALFYLSGALGILWVCVWLWRTADTPEQSRRVGRAELATIVEGRPQAPLAMEIPWAAIAREKAVWAIVLAHFCSNFGFNILLLWLPTYLDRTFAVPFSRLGGLALIPWAATFAASNLAGWIADRLRAAGVRVGTIRKSMQSFAFAGGALPLLALPSVATPGAAIALVSISAACSGVGMAAYGVNHLDVGPRYAGVLMGISNSIATVPGIVGVAAAGFILRATGSFSAVFYVIAAVYLAGLAGYDLWASGERRL
jgi:ACS family sodium-dependent inorganic phosphate cotransporter